MLQERLLLEARSDEIFVAKLRGYIFFGSALDITQGLLNAIAKKHVGEAPAKLRRRLNPAASGSSADNFGPDSATSSGSSSAALDSLGALRLGEQCPVKHVILDFTGVQNVDSTACVSLATLKTALKCAHGIELYFCSVMQPKARSLLISNGVLSGEVHGASGSLLPSPGTGTSTSGSGPGGTGTTTTSARDTVQFGLSGLSPGDVYGGADEDNKLGLSRLSSKVSDHSEQEALGKVESDVFVEMGAPSPQHYGTPAAHKKNGVVVVGTNEVEEVVVTSSEEGEQQRGSGPVLEFLVLDEALTHIEDLMLGPRRWSEVDNEVSLESILQDYFSFIQEEQSTSGGGSGGDLLQAESLTTTSGLMKVDSGSGSLSEEDLFGGLQVMGGDVGAVALCGPPDKHVMYSVGTRNSS